MVKTVQGAASVKKDNFFKKYSDVILLFLISRIGFLLIFLLAGNPFSLLTDFFDSHLYTQIANEGYSQQYLTAFFPMIPLIIRFFTGYGLLVINQVCFFFSMVLIKKVMEEYKSENSQTVLFIFSFSPVAYFSLICYTESIFFFLTLFAFYLFMKNKYPWLMGIIIGLSVFTRNTGSIVFFAIFAGMVIRWFRKENKFLDIILAYVPATLISVLYPIYLQIHFGNWKIFVDCQFSNWLKVRSNVINTYLTSFKMIFTDTYEFDIYTLTLFRINELLTLFISLFFIFLCIKEFKKLKKPDAVSVVSVLILLMSIVIFSSTIHDPNTSAPTRSFYRYYMGMFPAFTMLYDLNPKFITVLAIVSALSSFVISVVFFKASYFY